MAAPGIVVIGAGQGGVDTAAALRARGYAGPVTLVAGETVPPYQRPPLSKGFLTGAVGPDGIELRPLSFFSAQGIELVRGDRATKIDRDGRTVALASGRRLAYDRLVLATGSRPRTLPTPGAGLDGVHTLRGLDDAEALRQRLTAARDLRVVVVGAGFVGLELAATARRLGRRVTVIEAQPRALARAVSPELSARIADEHRRQGVRLLLRREVAALHGEAGQVRVVELADGERVPADLVVVGIGVLPEVGLAADAHLVVGDGIVVDSLLRTSDPAIHAIGDCARFPSTHAGRHIRLESVQNASEQARALAATICGDGAPYTAVPWFWSEQYAWRLQIAGLTTGLDETVVTGDPGANRFSVFCFRAGGLLGVESVNRPADHGIARRLLAAGTDLSPREAARPGFDLKTRVVQPLQSVPTAGRPVHA